MMPVPLIMLALAGSAEDCDLRATVAGELMSLHQNGASARTVAGAALSSNLPGFAEHLVTRILVAETSNDTSARELASFHFAAEIRDECEPSGLPVS